MSKKPIVLKGLIVSVHIPTESQITVSVDISGLGRAGYMKFVEKLQDIFGEIDPEYAKETENGKWLTKGRTIQGRHFIDYETAKRGNGIKVIPYPSRFVNILKNARKEIYCLIHDYCLVLQRTQHGYFERNLYVLPQKRAGGLMAALDKVEKECIDAVNHRMRDFRKTQYFEKIMETFKERSISTAELIRKHKISKIDLELTPLGIDPAILDQVVQDKVRESQRHYIEQAINEMRLHLEPLIHSIAAKQEIATAKERLEKLRDLAEQTGLEAIANTIIVPLSLIAEDPENAVSLSEEYFQNKDFKEGVNQRLLGLIS